jgi:hypothetical protein
LTKISYLSIILVVLEARLARVGTTEVRDWDPPGGMAKMANQELTIKMEFQGKKEI